MKTREKILDEALRLFARRGYDAVSVAEIADAVGIKAPSLYKHYSSKRAIFDSIIERMNAADAENARANEMPEEPEGEYAAVESDKIGGYSEVMLRYWTENDFACNFRRMLELEQYNSPEMGALYQNYIAAGPVGYMADIFARMPQFPDAYAAAVEFYAPMYLMYKLFDAGEDIDRLCGLLGRHVQKFLGGNYGKMVKMGD